MMKNIFKAAAAAAMLAAFSVPALAEEYMGMTAPGTVAQYAMYVGDKKQKDTNILLEVSEVKEDSGKLIATVLMNILDDKGKPSKAAKMMGLEEGLLLDNEYVDGAYTLVQDFIFAQVDDRMGFFMKVPAKMEVGQEIEGGSFSSSAKAPMVGRMRNSATLSDLKVTAEEDLTFGDKTLHCYVVEGNVNGEISSRYKQTGKIIFKFAPGIGIVSEEIPVYLDMKKPLRVELVAFEKK